MNDGEAAKFRNKNIGFVVQHFALIQEKTVYDNIALPLIYQKIKKSEINKRIDYILDKLSISEKKYAYPSQLSGGQCQRVAIARALVTKPTLILADEPTGALDEENGKKIIRLLKQINEQGTTVIMVTHDLELAKQGTKIIKMRDALFLQFPPRSNPLPANEAPSVPYRSEAHFLPVFHLSTLDKVLPFAHIPCKPVF